jgi:DNA polymerase III subunit epsilon
MSDASWIDGPMLGFDLETTGTDAYACSSVDVALVLDLNDDSEPKVWEWLVNPGIEIPLDATAVHGINTQQVIDKGVPTNAAMATLAYAIGIARDMTYQEIPFAVYNAAYDVPIVIRESFGMIGTDWPILDGMILDKTLDTYRPGKRTLTAVSAHYGLGVRNAHRAAGDCMSAINVTRAMLRKHYRRNVPSVSQLMTLQRLNYRKQMMQFIDYKRTHGEPDFDCPVLWPYDPDKLECLH